MAHQSLVYSFVARGTVILAEYAEVTGNFSREMAQYFIGVAAQRQRLQKHPTSNKFTYNHHGFTFNYLLENGFTYCVVAHDSTAPDIPVTFLQQIKEDFSKMHSGGKTAEAAVKSLNREFGPTLKKKMRSADHPEVGKLTKMKALVSKVAEKMVRRRPKLKEAHRHAEEISVADMKAELSEIKEIILENIEKVMDRGEKIEDLLDKTEQLRAVAQNFKKQGTQIDRNMWFKHMKTKLAVVMGIIAWMWYMYWGRSGSFR